MPPVDASGHSVAPSSEISKIGVAAVLIERGGQHMLGSLDAVVAARGTPVEALTRIRAHLTDVDDFLVNTR